MCPARQASPRNPCCRGSTALFIAGFAEAFFALVAWGLLAKIVPRTTPLSFAVVALAEPELRRLEEQHLQHGVGIRLRRDRPTVVLRDDVGGQAEAVHLVGLHEDQRETAEG